MNKNRESVWIKTERQKITEKFNDRNGQIDRNKEIN